MHESVRKVSNPGSSMAKVRRNVHALNRSLYSTEAAPSAQEDDHSDLSPTQVGYIGIGAVGGVVLLGLLGFFLRRVWLKRSPKPINNRAPFHPDLSDNPIAHGQLHQRYKPPSTARSL